MRGGGSRPLLTHGHRLLRVGVPLTLTALLLLTCTAPALASSSGVSDFQVITTGAAAQLSAVQDPPNFGPFADGIVDSTLGYVAGDFETGGDSSAQAAAFYPGNLVAQGPALFCSQVVPDIPGASCPGQLAAFNYPLLAQASYPTSPSATAPAGSHPIGGGAFPVAATPARSQAEAGVSSDSSATSLLGATGFPATPVAVTVGSASSLEQVQTVGDVARATVTTLLSNITIGGILHVGSLRSVDTVAVKTGGVVEDSPRTLLADVTLAGQAATIDSSGVHVAGHNGPALLRRLSAQGITVTALDANRLDQAGVARSSATGLEIDFTQPLNTGQQPPALPQPLPSVCANDLGFPCGVPDPNATYSGQLLLGQAGIAASAEPGINLSFNFALPSAGGSGSTFASPAGTGPSVGSAAPFTAGTQAALPQPSGAPAPGGSVGGLPGVLVALSRLQLKFLYEVLALGAAFLFAAWRASVAVGSRRGR